ncbi:putative nucleotidyltransferase [Sphaerotilus sulfidivorans]|uniref:Nucleotidyltransferase n=1 Tax=Sphaerotilus sulfidivorans TaxID=639200 RepID=A0A5C1PYY3_9BURK|nr:nucleotidyltransferase domain-containing protein [Sphaerotilus sulfidivorans]NZD46775.1 nucleotidyltransferase domain-containing protein [Sphaerotilus sulfidivorans]QEN00925.1 nucleotidyltransferase domain-containing protein [Sphaerotilus sulfidivorans]
MNRAEVVETLRQRLDGVLAVYLFGSVARGTAGPDSDVDLAVLVAGKAEPLALWDVAAGLAQQLGREVDLVDLRAASTVMQYQIITTGERLWALDAQAALYESFILSEKTALDTDRAGLLADIARTGRVYGEAARPPAAQPPHDHPDDHDDEHAPR